MKLIKFNYYNIKKKEFDVESQSIYIENNEISYKREIICGSRLGLPIFAITITSSKSVNVKKIKKQMIFIIARQIPSEAPSSYTCQGIIEFLLKSTPQAKNLRELYSFHIVPMVNPDGVVLGNSTTNFQGFFFFIINND